MLPHLGTAYAKASCCNDRRAKILPLRFSRGAIIDRRAEFFEDARLAAVINPQTMIARMLCEACSIRSRRTEWNEAAANAATHSGARARHARGRAIAPASRAVARMAAQGQCLASPWQAPQSLRPCAPRAAQTAWSPGPSPGRRPLRPACRQGRCVGHGEPRRHFPEVKHAERVGMRP